jgi:hypothetical protein
MRSNNWQRLILERIERESEIFTVQEDTSDWDLLEILPV